MSTVTLNWVLPTTRVDGTALAPSEIAGIDIFDDASPTPTTPIGSVTGPGTSFTTGTLAVGTHNFTGVVRDTKGHSSAQSAAASATIEAVLAAPGVITGLTATINP